MPDALGNSAFRANFVSIPTRWTFATGSFHPEKDIEQAHKVVTAFKAAETAGTGVLQVDGKFIDLPLVKQAQRILKIAEKVS